MSRYIEGLGKLAEVLEQSAVMHHQLIENLAGLSAHVLHEHAVKAVGDVSKLTDLAQATQDERTKKGYSANEPLLRDGTLIRDSIKPGHEGFLAGVGSDEQVLKYHEYGYVNHRTGKSVPPRPVLKIAMIESQPEIAALLESAVGASLGVINDGMVVPKLGTSGTP